MPRLLFVTPRPAAPPVGGRAALSALHQRALHDIIGDGFAVHHLAASPRAGWRGALAAMRGMIDGVTRDSSMALAARVAEEAIDTVYLDGSNLGQLARAIKQRRPATRVITLFHNVEARFFLGALRHSRSPRAVAVLIANTVAERLAVRFSDRRVTLTGRDSDGLAKLYGRPASDVLPLAIDEVGDAAKTQDERPFAPDYMLFVGGAYYANQEGIQWFAREVAARAGLALCIVGRGLEGLRDGLQRRAGVHLIGEVDDLGPWYRHARLVVAPIFDGSGMKTKVAEALMHGKRIAATSEALIGYEAAGDIGWRCDTREAFLAAIEAAQAVDLPSFDAGPRLRYEEHYSFDALRRGLARIIAHHKFSR